MSTRPVSDDSTSTTCSNTSGFNTACTTIEAVGDATSTGVDSQAASATATTPPLMRRAPRQRRRRCITMKLTLRPSG